MLIDLDQNSLHRFSADICIVGTGAAGLTLASVLLRSGASVMMLESGGLEHEDRAEDLNRCDTDRRLFEGAQLGRRRAFGGATMCWGGQLLPLEPIDFARRDWVNHSGWPITAEDLDPYYRAALDFAGADHLNFDSDVSRKLAVDNPFDPQTLRYYYSKWSPHPRFRDVLGEDLRLSEHIRVFLHANVTQLTLRNGGDHISEVRAVNTSRQEFAFTAPIVVLCTGGIETARLLLSNRHQLPHGLGNANDLVGRFFQDHPSLLVGTVSPSDTEQMYRTFANSSVNGLEVTPRLSLTPQQQKTNGVLNASAHFSFDYPPMLLRRAMVLNLARGIGSERRALRNLLDAGLRFAGPTVRLRRQGARLGAGSQFAVTVVSEQEPCEESRITLSTRTDRLGIPRARIAWHLTDKTWNTIGRLSTILQDQFSRSGLGELDLFPHITSGRSYWRVFPHDLYHHMGATRMGTTPETGVVDENCQVFGIENLYIASSSVFPTGGHSNCTLTIMALALRLADHLGVSPHGP
jgi:choline dehydrogenase-like flavoprotein